MIITTREARQLSTASEWPLIASSLPAAVSSLTDARLKSHVVRARTLRDKYRDLSKRQHRLVQPRRSGRPGEEVNVRTKQKAMLFAEILERFTAETRRRSAKVKADRTVGGRSRGAAARSTKKAKKSTTRAAAVPAESPAPTAPPAKVKRTVAPLVPKSAAVAARTGQHRIHAHVSSAARRQQGRRDNR